MSSSTVPNYKLHVLCAYLNRKAYIHKSNQNVYHHNYKGTDIVTFRGTSNVKQLGYSLHLWENSENIHDGYFRYTQECKELMLGMGLDMRKKMVFTGHSIGGIAAVLIANELNIDAEVVLFGSPRLTTIDFKETINGNTHLDIYNYVNDKDVIAKYPFIYYDHVKEPIYLETAQQYKNPLTYHSMRTYGFNIMKMKRESILDTTDRDKTNPFHAYLDIN